MGVGGAPYDYDFSSFIDLHILVGFEFMYILQCMSKFRGLRTIIIISFP